MRKCVKILAITLVICMLFANSVNVFAAQPIKKTSTPPAPTLGYSPGTPTNGNVTVTVYYPTSAVSKQYKLGTNGTWLTYSAPFTITANTYIDARYRNSSGVWSTSGTVTVSNIDKTPPANPTFSTSATTPTNQDVTVTISFGSDSIVKQYRIGSSGTWVNYTAPVVVGANTIIYAKAQDLAGNWSNEGILAVSNIDSTAPQAPVITASTTASTDQPVTITIGYDSNSSIQQYKAGINGIWTDYTAPVVLSANNTIYARSSDTVGNWSSETRFAITNIVKTVLGYTVKYWSTDTSSYNSMVANTSVLNEIATATYAIDGLGNLTGAAPTDQVNYAISNGIRPKLMVGNNFDAVIAKQLLESPENRQRLKNNILTALQTYSYQGVDIDIENIPAACRDYFTAFMSEIYSTLHPLGYGVSVAVPAKTLDSPNAPWTYGFDYKSLAMYSDYLMIMAYDEHYPGGTPGAVASIGWVTNVVNYALTVVPKEKIILGLAAYGYDWSSGATKSYSINGCYNLASQYGATINFDSTTKSKYFTYTVNGAAHTVWFEDGDTIASKLDLVNTRDLKGIGIWRLGLENANFWSTIKTKLSK
jgi:spore germination protein YaaH